jgi:hypothetical protein
MKNLIKISISYLILQSSSSAFPIDLKSRSNEIPLPKNQAEMRRTADPNGVSFFKSILRKEQSQDKKLSTKEIKLIFKKYNYLLEGNLKDVSGFLTMQDLCDVIKTTDNKHELNKFLFDAFQTVKPLTGNAEFWPEYLVTTSGGRAGLLADCLLDISAEKNFKKMFNHCIKSKDASKMESLLTAVSRKGRKKADTYNKLILSMIETIKDENVLEVLQNHLLNARE